MFRYDIITIIVNDAAGRVYSRWTGRGQQFIILNMLLLLWSGGGEWSGSRGSDYVVHGVR